MEVGKAVILDEMGCMVNSLRKAKALKKHGTKYDALEIYLSKETMVMLNKGEGEVFQCPMTGVYIKLFDYANLTNQHFRSKFK